MAIRELPFRHQVRHIVPDTRDARTAALRRQIGQDFGVLVPPFVLHLPVPDLACAFWSILRETTFGTRVDRAAKEAVAATVSDINACPYCVDAHTTMLEAARHHDVAKKIASGRHDDIADPDLRGVVAWARAHRQPDSPILRQRPFPDEDAPELIGVALAFHYVNRMVSIFATTSPFPSASAKLKPLFRRAASPMFRTQFTRAVRPGASLDLLPAAPLPDDLSWAKPDPLIARAYAQAAAAFESAGRQALPEQTREVVTARLNTWSGEDPGVARGWVDTAAKTLPAPQRPLARLAVLAAFAPSQVDDHVIRDARTGCGADGDSVLVAAAGWASFAAARRIGSWLHSPPTPASK